MLLASTLGQIAHPFYLAFAYLLAAFYAAIPNYAVAIALLTLVVMVVVFPITRRGTRSMMKMQLLSPELKKLQNKYKSPPGTPAEERNANRQALNEEMMALYKENGVSPTGGCLPMFLQFPIFLILYGTIGGLVHTTKAGLPDPLYISHSSRMFHDIKASGGHLMAFGINLGDSALTHGLSALGRAPYIALILVALVLQYIQLKQMSGRNPAAASANPQMQQMQKIMPLIFAIIYIRISAGVNVYFIVSSLFRVAQQEYMYRHDPDLRGSLEKLRARAAEDPKVAEAKKRIVTEQRQGRGGLLGRLLPPPALEGPSGGDRPTGGGGEPKGGKARSNGTPPSGGRSGGQGRSGEGRSGDGTPPPRRAGTASKAGSGQQRPPSRAPQRPQSNKRQRRPR